MLAVYGRGYPRWTQIKLRHRLILQPIYHFDSKSLEIKRHKKSLKDHLTSFFYLFLRVNPVSQKSIQPILNLIFAYNSLPIGVHLAPSLVLLSNWMFVVMRLTCSPQPKPPQPFRCCCYIKCHWENCHSDKCDEAILSHALAYQCSPISQLMKKRSFILSFKSGAIVRGRHQ